MRAALRHDVGLEPPPLIGVAAERRRHLRALREWEACAHGGGLPRLRDLDVPALAAAGAQTVVVALSPDHPPILRPLGGAALSLPDAPADSLLARLAEPIGRMRRRGAPSEFEADFVDNAGHRIRARGVLLPLSTDGVTIDRALAVFSAKQEEAPQALTDALHAELSGALRAV
jgi:hypothetical protein